MNNYFLWVVLPNLNCFFSVLSILGIVGCIICFIILAATYDDVEGYPEDLKSWKSRLNLNTKCFVISLFIGFLTCFIPEKKDMMQLQAVSIITELNGADKIPQKIIDKLNALLDQDKNGK